MHSKVAAAMLIAILPLAVGAQTVWVFPDVYQSPGEVVVAGTDAGQRSLQRQQEMEDRRRQQEVDRQERLERMELQREMDHARREIAEQRKQLQHLSAKMELQRTAAQEQQIVETRVTSEPRSQSSTTTPH
jgi:exonuclease VII large subunit